MNARIFATLALTLACTSAEARQFDFFLGDWDAFDAGSRVVKAHTVVTKMLDGCAIREVYSRTDGYTGESFSTYDAARKMWHQSWVTNRGELLLLDGAFKNGAMTLTGADGSAARNALIRGVWRVEGGGVRETATRSIDGGKNWAPLFDLEFRRHVARQ